MDRGSGIDRDVVSHDRGEVYTNFGRTLHLLEALNDGVELTTSNGLSGTINLACLFASKHITIRFKSSNVSVVIAILAESSIVIVIKNTWIVLSSLACVVEITTTERFDEVIHSNYIIGHVDGTKSVIKVSIHNALSVQILAR